MVANSHYPVNCDPDRPVVLVVTPSDVKDFFNYVDQQKAKRSIRCVDPCWIWKGTVGERGMPVFPRMDRSWDARRVSWVIHHKQELPTHHNLGGFDRCEELCVNPIHLVRRMYDEQESDYYGRATIIRLYAETARPRRGRPSRAKKQLEVGPLPPPPKVVQRHEGHGALLPPPMSGSSDMSALREDIVSELRELFTTQLSDMSVAQRKDKSDIASYVVLQVRRLIDQRFEAFETTVLTRLSANEDAVRELAAQMASVPRELPVPADDPVEVTPEPVTHVAQVGPPPVTRIDILVRAFRAHFGAQSVDDEDEISKSALDMVFDLAIGESTHPSAAVTLFSHWLAEYRDVCTLNPSMSPSAPHFAQWTSTHQE